MQPYKQFFGDFENREKSGFLDPVNKTDGKKLERRFEICGLFYSLSQYLKIIYRGKNTSSKPTQKNAFTYFQHKKRTFYHF